MPAVDRVILLRQAHIMADRFRLAEARQADGASRSKPPSRGLNVAGSSRSTPVTSARPISKISASSIAEAAIGGERVGLDAACDR